MGRNRIIFCYLMVAPAVILVLVITVYPMLESLRMSFLAYDLMRINVDGTPFVGLKNFDTILHDQRFLISLKNTFLFAIIVVSAVIFLGLMMAQLLNMSFRGRGVLRSLILIPWVTPPVVAATIWVWMYQPERSPFNQVLRALGIIQTNIRFLADTTTFLGGISIPMLAVSSVRIWNGLPFVTLMILAGLQSIPVELYEAAEIDGAGALARLRFITLPSLRPVLAILITLLGLGAIGHFEVNYVMTGGGPRDLTSILAVVAYRQAFSFYRFDLASAISTVILVLTSLIATFYIRSRMSET
jgi:ABC-type sugar transport system permease subunit